MSFQKFKLNQSAVALLDIYSLFRNGMVNMVKSDECKSWKQYRSPRSESSPEVAHSYKLVEDVVKILQESLGLERETEIKIEDIVEQEGLKTRRAIFRTKSWNRGKVFTVEVRSFYSEPDEGAGGWSSWSFGFATLDYDGKTIEIHPSKDHCFEKRHELPELVFEHIGSDIVARDHTG